MASIITWGSLAIIALVFILFMVELRKLSSANKLIKALLSSDNIIESIQGTILEELGGIYKKSINIIFE